LLSNCTDTYQLYNEIDHIVSYACQGWELRSGSARTCDPTAVPKKVQLTVGLEDRQHMLVGPPRVGGAATPPGAPGGDLSGRATALRGNGRAILNACHSYGNKRKSRCALIEDFPVPDFLIMESPTLAEMYWKSPSKDKIGWIKRSAALFPAILVLLKLRFLVRLHCALVELAGNSCSLQRLLSGLLAATCDVHQSPPPEQVYELLVETLKERLQQAWPLFLAFVATHGDGPPRSAEGRGDTHAAWLREHMGDGTDKPSTVAIIWQTIDDVFIAWLVQQKVSKLSAVHVMQELEFYGLKWPVVQTNLVGLQEWQAVRYVGGSQHRHQRAAQRQAHHLALNLELPALREHWEFTFDEMMEMARNVVAHPKTFNAGLCARIGWALGGGDPLGGTEGSLASDMDDEQLALFHTHYSAPRDCGRIKPGVLNAMRDRRSSWFVGHDPAATKHLW